MGGFMKGVVGFRKDWVSFCVCVCVCVCVLAAVAACATATRCDWSQNDRADPRYRMVPLPPSHCHYWRHTAHFRFCHYDKTKKNDTTSLHCHPATATATPTQRG
jgi:hypothetical protein